MTKYVERLLLANQLAIMEALVVGDSGARYKLLSRQLEATKLHVQEIDHEIKRIEGRLR